MIADPAHGNETLVPKALLQEAQQKQRPGGPHHVVEADEPARPSAPRTGVALQPRFEMSLTRPAEGSERRLNVTIMDPDRHPLSTQAECIAVRAVLGGIASVLVDIGDVDQIHTARAQEVMKPVGAGRTMGLALA